MLPPEINLSKTSGSARVRFRRRCGCAGARSGTAAVCARCGRTSLRSAPTSLPGRNARGDRAPSVTAESGVTLRPTLRARPARRCSLRRCQNRAARISGSCDGDRRIGLETPRCTRKGMQRFRASCHAFAPPAIQTAKQPQYIIRPQRTALHQFQKALPLPGAELVPRRLLIRLRAMLAQEHRLRRADLAAGRAACGQPCDGLLDAKP